ncbi:hypothetical protein [Chelativorans sp.]|uniref:hypothetical protein n=1 Tax=Chelativorans sp. TaxID=2203393 RepID=UPI0028116CA6|nr:hypothetical protein [Chelativorans sp.]
MATTGRGERKQAFAKLQRFVVEQALHLPQYTSSAMSIETPRVKDFVFGVLHSPKFHRVWLEEA